MDGLLKMIQTNYKQKRIAERKVMAERVKKHKLERRIIEARKMRRQKELKKHIFRTLGKMEKKKKRN